MTAVVLALLLILGGWLRWRFIHTVHLYPDEFVTLLAVQRIGETGLPVMPSGLFYDHGLLFSYLGYLAALFGQATVWVRYASLLCGLLTIGLIFVVGRRWFSPAVGLIAAAGLAIAPTAIHWSGRARMYALLQLLVLLTLWLAYEGFRDDKPYLRWLALLAYLGATLTQFAAVALLPPLVVAGLAVAWLSGAGEQPSSPRFGEIEGGKIRQRRNADVFVSFFRLIKKHWLDGLALAVILLVAFLVKRAGQPKGIEALDSSNAIGGILQVFTIYSDFSFNLTAGWTAIAPFYTTMPALLFVPFTLVAIATLIISRPQHPSIRSRSSIYSGCCGLLLMERWQRRKVAKKGRRVAKKVERSGEAGEKKSPITNYQLPIPQSFNFAQDKSPHLPISPSPHLPIPNPLISPSPPLPTLFLTLILLLTTLEIILLVSPDRRDAKYIFMLLPVLLLLGAQGMQVIGYWLLVISQSLTPNNSRNTQYASRFTFYASRFTPFVIITLLILLLTQPAVDDLLSNTGDDYEAAFAYVQQNWQDGDVVMTGTPAAAALYLGRNDFYSVQKRGGYDYRLLDVEGQTVDRWLASPAIRTAEALHDTLARHNVWLVLERWGLQREYYDLPFQQQLLAQTDPRPEAEAQGIFVLRSKTTPRPLAPDPAQPVEATFGDVVQLTGYTVEPDRPAPGQPLRLTLYWQAVAPMDHTYTVFVHLRQPAGGNVAQADHRPLGDLYPTTLWPVGETIRESSDLFLPPDLPPGRYELWVGLYLLETGARLPVQNDTSGENAVRLGLIEVGE